MHTTRLSKLTLTLLLGFITAVTLGMLCQRQPLCHASRFAGRLTRLFGTTAHTVGPSHVMTSAPAERRVIIVVGSGLAGLAAAHEALRHGARVRMLERGPKTGGNSIKASSGINGAGTRFQKARGIETDTSFYGDTVRSAGTRFAAATDGAGGIDRAGLIDTLTRRSAEAVTWLADDVGVDLSVVAPLGGHSVARTHRGAGTLPPGAAIVTTLLKKLRADPRFELTTSAEVVGLTTTPGGAVTGVRYTHEEQRHELVGPVVFAAGGFAGDARGLLAQYRPDLAGMPSTNEARPGAHGLLTDVGAELVDMDSVQIHPTGFVDPKAPTAQYKFLAAEMLRGEGGILLSSDGRRFVNELATREVVSRAIMEERQPAEKEATVRQWDVTLVLDPGACEAAGSHLGFYLFKGFMEKKKVGELAPNMIEALDQYAEVVASGQDNEFGRSSFGHWRLQPGKTNREEVVCVGNVTPIVHFTMGGAAFDAEARVLRRGAGGVLEPIEGLWAAGEITGGVHGDNRLGGSSLLECAVFGRTAGRQAAKALSG
ncbi:Fumarate reductase 2 like protein [Verticillium longisporum]|nr:Fumarate reductase 2 like protein [Verticillium longisporum]KAG7141748.1 Fumarate reductase 2 like protein [Verticillium longisporum]